MKKMELQYYWDLVNNCNSHKEVAETEKILRDANISNSDFDDLMMALSFILRELYHNNQF